ncbi:hypothetical protein BDB00DRAFT_760868 [Zychaea mexicana]|uniref:uncharacterized protein n=1 Tax=Zychaea mexicana TaxID=64656 RepID=UPI0022FE158B|nr:uncharacterized protein BDB00DRAFT_760868 [Zychaea mexicana]KAI9495072.1 hypothetical protein BDB00DRAFT_760868 [Zychaea mexicana]
MVRLVSLPAAIATLLYAAVTASAAQTSDDGQFNISSPNNGGIFVAGQILPLTYSMDDATSSSFGLNIYLTSSTVANATTTAIAAPADVSKDASSALTEDGKTIYQHIINYALPASTAAGSYSVIFEATNTNVNTTIPVTIRAAAAASSSSSSLASSSATGSSSSSPSSSSDNNGSSAGHLAVSAGFLGAVIASVAAVF